jgi:predicted regulator of Ras-like GTPase activity (Roadblock/LC7/MglB family)
MKEMSNVTESLERLVELAGARSAALVDSDSGMVLGHAGSDANLEITAAANTEVVRAQLKSLGTLGSADVIDDILITLSTQYDIVRPLAVNPSIFLYLAMDKNKSNMALARFKVAECEGQLEL